MKNIFKKSVTETQSPLFHSPLLGGVSGERVLNNDTVAVRRELAAPLIAGYLNGELDDTARQAFLARCRQDRIMRLAVITELVVDRTGYPEEAEQPLQTLGKSMQDYAMVAPGSSYVIGDEFSPATVAWRQQYGERIQTSLEAISEIPPLEALALENAWRFGVNADTVRKHRSGYPVRTPIASAFMAVEAARVGYTADASDLYQPILPLRHV
jgi:hypothetical protein